LVVSKDISDSEQISEVEKENWEWEIGESIPPKESTSQISWLIRTARWNSESTSKRLVKVARKRWNSRAICVI